MSSSIRPAPSATVDAPDARSRTVKALAPLGALLVALACIALVRSGLLGLVLGGCASVVAMVGLLQMQGDRRVGRVRAVADLLTPVAFVALVHFAVGAWVLQAGYRAPDLGYVKPVPIDTFTVIESRDDPLRHEAVLQHRVDEEVSTALLGVSAVHDARVERVRVEVIHAAGTHARAPTDSPLRAAVQFDDLRAGRLKLRVHARLRERVTEKRPVTLIVFAEHGKRDAFWHLVRWYRQRYG